MNGLYYITDAKLFSVQQLLNNMIKNIEFLSKNANSTINMSSISGNYGDLQQYGDWFVNVLGPLSTQLINGAITPVSYTHLDVYKRQHLARARRRINLY